MCSSGWDTYLFQRSWYIQVVIHTCSKATKLVSVYFNVLWINVSKVRKPNKNQYAEFGCEEYYVILNKTFCRTAGRADRVNSNERLFFNWIKTNIHSSWLKHYPKLYAVSDVSLVPFPTFWAGGDTNSPSCRDSHLSPRSGWRDLTSYALHRSQRTV